MKETELVKNARQGDKESFCILYGAYKDRLYRYAYYKLGNAEDAQDAVSDCIVSAFEQIKNLRRAEAFSSWIFRILHITCSKYVKRQIDARETSSIEAFSNSRALSDSYDNSSAELNEALDILNNEEREIVLLCVVAGLTSKEAAKLTDMTAGSVRSKLSRSLSKMRSFLE